MDLLPYLLPLGTQMQVEALTVDAANKRVLVELQSIVPSTRCPLCSTAAHRVHSHYMRTLADLPWADLDVRLQLHVRKFFCDNPSCTRKIFTERLHRWSLRRLAALCA
jgi:transposase